MALARKEWEPEIWGQVAAHAAAAVSGAARDADAWPAAARAARHVLRTFSTSFFMVTRFLPREKREQVEVIYAAVRYPDEIVDTFAWEEPRKYEALDAWEAQYEAGLGAASLRSAVQSGVPVFAAAFAEVVRRNGIPQEHYRDFLRAMRRDVRPGVYATMPDLIDEYVYGSAIVIGYFLAYVYGTTSPDEFPRALTFARDLGTALQLTNFVRDVGEDQGRGRLYLPLDYLRAEGITRTDAYDPAQRAWSTSANRWSIGRTFMAGVAWTVPAGGIPGGIGPVTWTARFWTNAPGVVLSWQWAAAVYGSFSPDPNQLGVKPVDDFYTSPYHNLDLAGTPEAFKSHVRAMKAKPDANQPE